ncbi:Cytochrome P450 monooxygenase mpaDE [Penicillium rolfsii]|nr:Cytochrome P450 monooxygenase mpaDE [Penicillium rolfsii]
MGRWLFGQFAESKWQCGSRAATHIHTLSTGTLSPRNRWPTPQSITKSDANCFYVLRPGASGNGKQTYWSSSSTRTPMASANVSPDSWLPEVTPNQAYPTVSALDGGELTLPEELFITNAEPGRRVTVPSMSFLICHPSGTTGQPTNIVFDLGMKRDPGEFPPAMQAHIRNRQPTVHHPDVADSLRAGGLSPERIDLVILSHVHWDHVGTPADFPSAEFLVGAGTLHLLRHGAPPHYPAEIFIPDLLPDQRTKELPPSGLITTQSPPSIHQLPPCIPAPQAQQTHHAWAPLGPFPSTVDLFGDGTIYVIDSPGHLIGHVNLLVRVAASRCVYLGGDCCHDVRILTGERDIALYPDTDGSLRSVHVDTDGARGTLARIQRLTGMTGENGHGQSVEVVVAHDAGWRKRNPERFFPGTL